MKSGIYSIKNKINNKRYIGQSINIERRWRKHISRLNNGNHENGHLQNSWDKYGEENFEFTVLEECEPEQLNDLEIYYIKKYDTFNNREKGYNLESGGNKNKEVSDETRIKISKALSGEKNPNYGKHHSPETKRKMSENHGRYWLGRARSEEYKKKMSEAMSGDKNPRYWSGKYFSDEHKRKMSEANSKYTIWNPAKCSYYKRHMFNGKREGSEPARCFQTKYNAKNIPIGYNIDFTTCEIIHDLINHAIK